MLLVFFFLPLTGIYFSLLGSRQHDILNERKQFLRVVMGAFTGSGHEYVPQAAFVKDLLGFSLPC